jgi:hypothetical protein
VAGLFFEIWPSLDWELILSQNISFISWEYCQEVLYIYKTTWPKYLANKYANVYFGQASLWPILQMQEVDRLHAGVIDDATMNVMEAP